MKRLKPPGPEASKHLAELGSLNRALAARGVAVFAHRNEPAANRWLLFVGRKGRHLRVIWEGATGTLRLEPAGAADGEPETSAQVDPSALYAEALDRVSAFFSVGPE